MLHQFVAALGVLGVINALTPLTNGDFNQVTDSRPVGWQAYGQYRILPDAGINGAPAVELTFA